MAASLCVSAADMTAERRSFRDQDQAGACKQCYECHSQDAKKLGGKLLLDAPSEIIAGESQGQR